MQRIVQLPLLKVDAREPECSFISHRFVDRTFEYRFDRATRPMVHAIVEFEIAHRKVRIGDVKMQCVELRFVQATIRQRR